MISKWTVTSCVLGLVGIPLCLGGQIARSKADDMKNLEKENIYKLKAVASEKFLDWAEAENIILSYSNIGDWDRHYTKHLDLKSNFQRLQGNLPLEQKTV